MYIYTSVEIIIYICVCISCRHLSHWANLLPGFRSDFLLWVGGERERKGEVELSFTLPPRESRSQFIALSLSWSQVCFSLRATYSPIEVHAPIERGSSHSLTFQEKTANITEDIMSGTTPFATYSKQFTSRLRARMHAQSFSNAVQESQRLRRSSAGLVAEQRVRELVQLQKEHERFFDPKLRVKALTLLRTLPLISTDEDPHFVMTMRALRVCMHFNAVESPATFALLNHLTRHTFLLDGHALFQFCCILSELHHPQTTDILYILLPRIREVAREDLTAHEAVAVLRLYHQYGVHDSTLATLLTQVFSRAVMDISISDLCCCVAMMPALNDPALGREFIAAAEHRISAVLRESTTSFLFYWSHYAVGAPLTQVAGPSEVVDDRQLRNFVLMELHHARRLQQELYHSLKWLCWGPRRLLNELVRSALVWSEPRDLTMERHQQMTAASNETEALSGGFASGDDARSDVAMTVGVAKQTSSSVDHHTVPVLSRQDICACINMLHFTSYRHEAGVSQLLSRVATMEFGGVATTDGHLVDLTSAVEGGAYFYAVKSLPALHSILEEILDKMRSLASQATQPQQHRLVEAVVIRLMMSMARLAMAIPPLDTTTSTGTSTAEISLRSGRGVVVTKGSAYLDYPFSTVAQFYSKLPMVPSYIKNLSAGDGAAQTLRVVPAIHLLYSTTILRQISKRFDAAEVRPASLDTGVWREVLVMVLEYLQQMSQSGKLQPILVSSPEMRQELSCALHILQEEQQLERRTDGAPEFHLNSSLLQFDM